MKEPSGPKGELPSPPEDLTEVVFEKEGRRLLAKAESDRGWISWVGYFGIIGWSISIPTVGGAFLGWWIDRQWASGRSWTLILLAAGLALGCGVAWRWLHREGGFK